MVGCYLLGFWRGPLVGRGWVFLLSVGPVVKHQPKSFGCDSACVVAGSPEPGKVYKYILNLLASFNSMGQGGVVSKSLRFWKFCKSKEINETLQFPCCTG